MHCVVSTAAIMSVLIVSVCGLIYGVVSVL